MSNPMEDFDHRRRRYLKDHLERLDKFAQQRRKYLKEVAMSKTKFDKTKDFKNELIKFFERNSKSGWGKNQIVMIIKDLWIKQLEALVESQKED